MTGLKIVKFSEWRASEQQLCNEWNDPTQWKEEGETEGKC